MNLKKRLKRGLIHSREVTKKLFSEFEKPEDWMVRAAPGSNHALWIAGHLMFAENYFTGLVDPSKKADLPEYAKLFGIGTTVSDNRDDYPPLEDVLEKLRERRNVYLKLLKDCSKKDLKREVKDGPPYMFDVAAVFQMSAWHEALHTGQLTVIHRKLGHSPIANRMMKKESESAATT